MASAALIHRVLVNDKNDLIVVDSHQNSMSQYKLVPAAQVLSRGGKPTIDDASSMIACIKRKQLIQNICDSS